MKTIHASAGQRASLAAADDGEPIAMVNLLKFHAAAQYPAGSREAALGLSGRAAYRQYVDGFLTLIEEYGGSQVYWGDTAGYMIGQGEWDAVWINHFPSYARLEEITRDPRYAALKVHRVAGLAYQNAIVTRPDKAPHSP